jgi:hypothetical protein
LSEESPTPAPGGWLERHRRLWISLAVVVGLALMLRIALPYAIAWGVGWGAMRTVGLDARVANVDLSLFGGNATIEGLWVAAPGVASPDDPAPDPTTAILALDRVHADVAWTDLVRGTIHLTQVVVENPSSRVARQADGGIDPLAGATPPPPDPDAEPEPEPEQAAAEEEAGGGMPVLVDSLVVRGVSLRLMDAVDGAELAAFDLEELDLNTVRLEAGGFGLGGISLEKPTVRVQRDFALDPTGGRVPAAEEADAPPEAAAEQEAPASPGTPAPGRSIGDLEIERAAFTLLVGTRKLDVALQLKADAVSLDSGSTFPFSFGLDVDKGHLQVDGTAGIAPPYFDGKVAWRELPIPLLAMGVRPDLGDWVRSSHAHGDLDVNLRMAAAADAPPGLRVSGRLELGGLELAEPGGENLRLAWKQLEILLEEVSVPFAVEGEAPQPIRVHVAKLGLTAPDLDYTQPSDAIDKLLNGPAPAAAEPVAEAQAPEPEAEPEPAPQQEPAAPAPPPEIRVDRIQVTGGTVRFRDTSVQPVFDQHFPKLALDVRGVTLPGPAIENLDLELRMRGTAYIKAKGHVNPSVGKLDLDIHRLALPPANGYVSKAGLEVDQGWLSVDTDMRAKGKHWKVDSDVTLHDFHVDKAKSGSFAEKLPMSLDMALAVLRSPDGDIALPVPLEFDEGELEVEIGEIISAALSQALVGAATIPLKAVGMFFSGGEGKGGFSAEPIQAVPGETFAAEGGRERAGMLLDFMIQKPELAVVIIGTSGPAERDAVAERILRERVVAGDGLPKIEDGAGLIDRTRIQRALKHRAEGKEGKLSEKDEALLQRYVEATPVPEARYDQLARARAQRTKTFMLENQEFPAKRIRVSDERRENIPGVVFEFEAIEP